MNDLKLEKINKCFEVKVFTLLIILSLFLHEYKSGIPGVSLADLFLGLSCIMVLVKSRFKLSFKTVLPLVILSFISVFLTLSSFLIQGLFDLNILTRLIRYNYYILILAISFSFFNLMYGIKVYRITSKLVAIYIISQFIVYNTMGVVLPVKILPVSLFRELDLNYIQQMASTSYYRPSGVFVEPGYAAHFLLPALAFSLNGWGIKKGKFTEVFIIYGAMILTTSAQAILLGSFTIIFYILFKLLTSKNYVTLIKYTTISILCFFLAIPLMRLDNIQILISRINHGPRAGGSAALRLFRGYAIYNELPLIYKMIGVGHGNIGNFVTTYDIFTKYDVINMSTTALDYVNGISTILLYYGFVGLVLASVYVKKLIARIRNPEFLTIAFSYILLNLMEGAMFNIVMVFYLSLLYGGTKNNLDKNKRTV